MLFKNARIYRFTKPFGITAEQLDEALASRPFRPCYPNEMNRLGWVSPLGRRGEQRVHAANGDLLICLQQQEKLLPGPVVSEFVDERVEAIEIEQGRKVRKKEKDEIKEQVVLEMLPKAFPRNRKTYAYLSPRNGYLIVDATTAKAAEDFCSVLRLTLGSLPVRPVSVNQSPAFTFTGWLQESIELPSQIELGADCWMADPSEDGGKVIARGLDLNSDEVRNHLDSGMQATKLAITWDDNVSFVLDESLAITRLRFGEAIQEQLNDVDADDAVTRFDAEFCLMALELERMIPALLDALGGEDRTAVIEPESLAENVLSSSLGEPDPLYDEAVAFVTEGRRVSICSVQRKFKIGYNRAANLVEAMEAAGVVSAADQTGAREALAPKPAEVTA